MNAPMATTPHAVVWIDHHHAKVLHLYANRSETRLLQAHVHPTAQHGSEVRSEHEFFAEVCGGLEGVGNVLVTGGKTALIDFRHYAEKHRPQTAARIVAYDIVDHPTDNQLAALGRKVFEL